MRFSSHRASSNTNVPIESHSSINDHVTAGNEKDLALSCITTESPFEANLPDEIKIEERVEDLLKVLKRCNLVDTVSKGMYDCYTNLAVRLFKVRENPS